MESYQIMAAIQMVVRWVHVFSAILWIGQTFLFHLMERNLVPPTDGSALGRMWMLHGGGYYQVEKRSFSAQMPEHLVWFKWEAAMTWVSGAILLALTYYFGGLMTEAGMNPTVAAVAGISSIVFGWVVYDMLVRSPLGGRPIAFAVVGFILILLLHNGLAQVMSPRAAYIHVGATIGTIMVSNVWMRILPSQRKMLKAVRSGAEFDSSVSREGPLRSRHNSYLVLPLVLIMISNHYPTVSYGSNNSTLILGTVIIAGWIVARWLIGPARKDRGIGTSPSSEHLT